MKKLIITHGVGVRQSTKQKARRSSARVYGCRLGTYCTNGAPIMQLSIGRVRLFMSHRGLTIVVHAI
jgi:hypothetical protein